MVEIIETEIFARMPDSFRIRDRLTQWHAKKWGNEPIDCFLEGPSFDRQGNLFLVDIPFGRIFRVAPDGRFELFAEYDGQPNGLKIRRDGQIFIADQQNGILRLDPATRAVTPVVTAVAGGPMKGPNDLFFASSGNLYFTDQGETGLHDPTGRVCRLAPDGRCEILLDNVPGPNGIVVDPAERTIFLAVTRGNCIWRIGLRPDGSVIRAGIFIQLSGGLVGPDGLALDRAGNLVIGHAGYGTVWVYSRLGDPIYRIRSCLGLNTTNIAFGGADGRSLFIVESRDAAVLRARLPEPGERMYSPAPAEAGERDSP